MTKRVIDQIMAAYGGKDTIEKIHAVCAQGRIAAFAFNEEGSYSYCVARNRRMRVDIAYADSAEHRLLNGPTASVKQGDDSPQILSGGANYLSVVYQYEQLSLPGALLDPANDVHYKGREPYNGRPVEILTFKGAGSSPLMKIYVDAENGRIVKTSCAFLMGGSQMVLSSDFADFRKVGNTILPFRFVNYAGGDKIAETSIQDYKLNPPMADDAFLLPGSAAE